MLAHTKAKIRRHLLRRLGLLAPLENARLSYAQEGEDVLLWRILDSFHHIKGTYVDVGCNHPWKHSNTALLYLNGWRGVAVDPNPQFTELFEKERPEDQFLNIGLSDKEGVLEYHSFEQPLYNTFCAEHSRKLVKDGIQPQPNITMVKVSTLRQILHELWPGGKAIDLLSIDAEGLDGAIIDGHDFGAFPVSFLFVEFDSLILTPDRPDPLVPKLESLGYVMISKLWKSALFLHADQASKFGIVI